MKPHFTYKQLIEIYEASGRSIEIDALQASAKQLYPDVLEDDGQSPIFVISGSHKGFLVDGDYCKAKFSILSRLVNGIGIMEDGTPLPY